MDIGDTLEHDEGWEQIKKLIDLAKSAPATLSPERKRRVRERLLERLERDRIETLQRVRSRRLIARAFVAGASTMLLAGLLLRVVSGGLPWLAPSAAELARKQAPQHAVAE